jgi:type II secretory pathway component PulK
VRILAHREALGGRFTSLDEFLTVAGLGSRTAERLRPWVAVPPSAELIVPSSALTGEPP